MKLKKLTIRNYKGIKKLSLNIENISLIIGPNNCNKSTVLQALVQFSMNENKTKKKIFIIDILLMNLLVFMLHLII
ncbi:AAA family ATPase [Psychrobacillus sp. FSL K6-1415]|uniref:AAA family ATPase n=1 Tax=Psychrobacillus sp. FSL K6-1415 TaxID=2921544 RepID=UPI0030FA94DC